MRADRFFAELYRRNPLLALVGWLHVVALVACAVGWLTDDRLVLGANAWIKPLKFMASIAVYVWTIGWFTRYLRRPRWVMKTVSVVIAVSVIVKSTCIVLQAARGTRSHFNFATDFDAAVFYTMALMIVLNLLMVIVVLTRFARPVPRPSPAYLWGIRAGIMLFLAGGAIGAVMLVRGAHTVGAADGGPGLPFFGWSTIAGDLRVAHGVALHALQLLPLAGWALSRWRRLGGSTPRVALLGAAAAVYAALVWALFRDALAGNPLL